MLPTAKLAQPSFVITVPSTGKQVRFRPFVSKEEKVFLMAKVAGAQKDILEAIKTVIRACDLSMSLNPDELTLTDMEYIYLQLIARSVNEIVKVSYRDNEDNQVRDFEVDLTKVPVVEDPKNAELSKVQVTKDISLQLRQPTADLTSELNERTTIVDATMVTICNSIGKIFDGDEVHDAREADQDELTEFVEQLPAKATAAIRDYLATLPSLKHTITWKNDKGRDREVVLSKLEDFFT